MSCFYYTSCSLYCNTAEFRLFCDDPDLDDEIIDAVYEFDSGKDMRISDMSLCLNVGKNVPEDYESALLILDEVLKILDRPIDLSDFKEKIKNKFFSKDISQ